VDGCDVSEDMLAYCQQAAEREGFAPRLYRQALAHLDVPRAYQTIVACGVFGVGADDTYRLISNYYFPNEVRLLLEKAGFTVEAEKGTGQIPT